MKKEVKDKIRFRAVSGLCTFADCRDVFYWLNMRDRKIAEEFRVKFEKVERDFAKADKVKKKEIDGHYKTWAASYTATPEVVMKLAKKPWWKFF